MDNNIQIYADIFRNPIVMASALAENTRIGFGPLTDAFARAHTYLRIAVTDRCNLRCLYCMPPAGVSWAPSSLLLTDNEFVRLCELFARLGVRKIRLTGGEPLLRPGLASLAGAIKGIGGIETVGITTNGVRLAAQARALRVAGVDRLNVSLDSLRRNRFEQIARRDGLGEVLSGIDAALEAGFTGVKINTVVMGGCNDDELADFVELTRGLPVCVRFIEFMPFLGNRWCDAHLVSYASMRAAIEARYAILPVADPDPSRVAKEFKVPGFAGSIGFITSMTEHFCGGCSRLRITADGQFKTCLFRSPEVNLRDALRGGAADEEIAALAAEALYLKPRQHADIRELERRADRSMFQVGG
ncbi:MAG TPA: GTP 3',8-cyclase MoaA [Candidatus Hydrogenedentes bacterium]|nr:GTP 3',8-cyclase MoaA [Candidatus Hydrogenedentota bacterium]HNT88206.1 GTP 3',8-cyclase MoaA [Candidatus Hydrogenedentota bacterium]